MQKGQVSNWIMARYPQRHVVEFKTEVPTLEGMRRTYTVNSWLNPPLNNLIILVIVRKILKN